VGWWSEIPPDPYAPIMIVSAKFNAALDEKKTHVMVGYFKLRQDVFLQLYVQVDLWRAYLESRPKQAEREGYENTKCQAPGTRKTPSYKHQGGDAAWCFSGAWWFGVSRPRRASRQLIGRAIGACQQLARFLVAVDFFAGDIPFQFAATQQHRDQTEVPGNGRMVRGFHRGDGGLAGLHARDEVGLVVVGFVKFDLAQFLRKLLEITPFRIRGVELAAVHPYPAIRADPFRPAFDFRIPAGDDHRDVIGILEFNAIFRASVPNRVLGRKLAVPFDFRRSRAVEIQTPMGNIAMVADPVEQLAPACVVIPSPVHVNPATDI